ncbi:MAG TPA: tetratricopeptide repeat protein [Bacteroidia bacterium]|nr:tetratricopeptide repeat protein [Bacteroidia bacterium]
MAKRIEPKQRTTRPAAFVLPELQGKGWLWLNNFWLQATVVFILSLTFYYNSTKNFYALDDDIIMRENMFVQKGFGGISDILSNDAYKSFYQSMGVEQQLAGGRYRPLSIVTFAIEQDLFGECYGERASVVRDSVFTLQRAGIRDANFQRLAAEKNDLTNKIRQTTVAIAKYRHWFQVIWFGLSMVVLLWFLRECVFRKNTDIAFLAALLFTIHPIHTEVIANVKSRDEIFSLLFICLTFIFIFRFDISKRMRDAVAGGVAFLLAFLSKEYAIVLLVFALLPAGLMIFHKRKFTQVLIPTLPILIVTVVYFMLRFSAIGTASAPVDKTRQDPLNDPYLYANAEQKMSSIINRLDDYLWLQVKPYPLVSDYSYQHFPYSRLDDWDVWLSLLVHIGLVVLMINLFLKRHPIGFALLWYFAFFMLINNIVFDVGATMGERLIYHSSAGFCMAIAWLLVKGVERIPRGQPFVLTMVFAGLAVPAFRITTERNVKWRNDFTLFTTDVKTHPNSALTNGNAGARYMDRGLTYLGKDTVINGDTVRFYGRDLDKLKKNADTAIIYLRKATQLHKKYVNGWLNLGLCYYYKENFQEAADAWAHAYEHFPSNPMLLGYQQMLLGRANEHAARKEFAKAAEFLGYAATSVPNDAQVWMDYAGASFMAQDFGTAKKGFNTAVGLNPDLRPQAERGYGAANNNEIALRAFRADSSHPDSIIRLAAAYAGTVDFYPESKRLLRKALARDPEHPRARRLLDSVSTLEKKAQIKQ